MRQLGLPAIAVAEDRSRRIDLVITDVVMPGMLANRGDRAHQRTTTWNEAHLHVWVRAAVLDSRGRLEPGRALSQNHSPRLSY